MNRTLLILLLLALTFSLFAEEELRPYRLDHADSLLAVKQGTEYVTNLKGNVHFFYGTTEFYARNVRFLDEQKIVYMIEKVKIVEDTLTLTANRATYYRDIDKLELQGGVRLTVQRSDYTRQVVRADRVDWFREMGKVQASGYVKAWDTRDSLHAEAGRIDYDLETGYGYMIMKPVVYRTGKDSLKISSQKMEYYQNQQKLVAMFDVVTESKDYRALSDFLIYYAERDEAIFTGNPEFHTETADGFAREFHLFFEENDLDHATFIDSCRILFSAGDDQEKNNRITSETMRFNFDEENRIRSFEAEGNIHSHVMQESDPDQDKEYFNNQAIGQSMQITIDKDNKIESIVMKQSASGTYKFEGK